MFPELFVSAFTKQRFSTLTLGIILLNCSLFSNGCAIRTSQAEHYFGPMLYTTGQQATVQSMSEQRHFPFLAEIGTQWGLSVGIIRRVRAIPLILDEMGKPDSTNRLEHIWSWGGIQLSSNTFLSLLYLLASPSDPPEFLARSIVGASIGIGSEQNALTAGTKRMTEFRPLTSGIHRLCYQSEAPGRMNYVVAERLESISQFHCGRITSS
jgi:hypothetical protein